MKILKFLPFLILFVVLFSCKSKDKNDDNKNEDSTIVYSNDTVVINNFSEDISLIPEKNIPFKVKIKQFFQMDSLSTIFVDKSLFGNEIGYGDNFKALFIVNLNANLKLLAMSYNPGDDYFPKNFRFLILSKGKITAVSYPFIIEDLTETYEFSGLEVKKINNDIEIDYLFKNDVLSCLDTAGLGLSNDEKVKLLTSVTKEGVDSQGKLKEIIDNAVSDSEGNDNLPVFVGKIGDKNVVMELIESEITDFVTYGKIFFLDDDLGFLMSIGYTPDMCFSSNYSCFPSAGDKIANIDFIVYNEVFGHLKTKDNIDLPVRMKRSDKTFKQLVPNSVLLKINDKNFEKYISHFAESKADFSLDNKYLNESGIEFMVIEKNYKEEYIKEDLFVSSFKGGETYHTYHYGFVFDNGDDLTCVIPVKISYLNGNKGEYRYLFIDYSYDGEIKSFDVLEEIPKKLTMRGYVTTDDEPKDLFLQASFGNYMMQSISFFVDIPAGIDIDNIVVYEQTGEDYTETKDEKEQVYTHNLKSYKHPHIFAFKLNGNLGCNDLFFEIKDSKGKIIFDKRFDMHCGE